MILPVGMLHCEPYSCSDYIGCETVSEEEDQEQLAELLALLQDANPAELKTFIEANPEDLSAIPERDLLVFRSGCNNRVLTLFPLSEGQSSLIEG